MDTALVAKILQTTTQTPNVGPAELGDYWPVIIEGGWFLLGFLVVTIIGWFIIHPVIARTIRRRNRNNPTIQEAISRYLRLLVIIIGVFVGAGMAGYGRFLADSALVIAAGTLAVGVAGQTVIGSLISGLVLVGDPEFNIGDYISWDGGQGTVQSITLRVTRVHTPNGELVTIPNTMLTSQVVTRPYGRGNYRVVEHIGLAYEADVEEAMDALQAVAEELPGILVDPEPTVYLDDFGPDSVVIRVQYWIEDPRRRDVFKIRSQYAKAVKTRLESAGITISPASKRELSGRIKVTESM